MDRVSRARVAATTRAAREAANPCYRWIVLSNTTLGVLMASINASILLIALPDIFRGIRIDPLQPGNTGLMLWLIMGYMVVTAVLVVSFGRLGDMYGRVRMYNAGFAIFTVFSILRSVTWMTGFAGAMRLIVMRIMQGVGGAVLFATSNAIITDAFPVNQRGLALGLNQVAGIAGSFIGLIIGGLLGPHVLAALPAHTAADLTGHGFFPSLISAPFADGLAVAFWFAIAACVIAAVASALRGGRFVYGEDAAARARVPVSR